MVCVYVIDPETNQRTPFQYLYDGAAFNFVSAINGYYSMFEFVAETECTFLQIEVEELEILAKGDHRVMGVVRDVKSRMLLTGNKYDYYYYCPFTKKPPQPRKTSTIDPPYNRSSTFAKAKTIKLGKIPFKNIINPFLHIVTKSKAKNKVVLPKKIKSKDKADDSDSVLTMPEYLIEKIREVRSEFITRLKTAGVLFLQIDE